MAASDFESSKYITSFDATSDKTCIFSFSEIEVYDKKTSITFINGTKVITEKTHGGEYKDVFTQIKENNLTVMNSETEINIHNISIYNLKDAYHWFITLGKREHPSTRNIITEHDIERLKFRYYVKEYYDKEYTHEFLLKQFYDALQEIKLGIYNPNNYIPMRLFLEPTDYPNFIGNKINSQPSDKEDIYEYILGNEGKYINKTDQKEDLRWGVRISTFKGYDFMIGKDGKVKYMNDYYALSRTEIIDGELFFRKHLFGKIYSRGYFFSSGSYDQDGVLMKTDHYNICHTWFDIFYDMISKST